MFVPVVARVLRQDVALLRDLPSRVAHELEGERVAHLERVDDRAQAVEPRLEQRELGRVAAGQCAGCHDQSQESRRETAAHEPVTK